MSRDSDEEESLELLKAHGKIIRRVTHGTLWGLPGGQTVQVYPEGKKGVDPRAFKNQLADVRRALRAAGILPTKGEKEEMPPPKSDEKIARPAQEKIAKSIHIQRRRRVTEESRATIDLPGLADILGLVPEGMKIVQCYIETPERDDDRTPGPVELVVVAEKDEGP
jgi:hypothetical protein